MQECVSDLVPPPVTAPLSYPARTSVLDQPRTYRIEPGALVVERAPAAQSVPFAAITEIRLRYFPTRVQTNRYECIVKAPGHGTFKITNEYFEGVLRFRDQSPAFRGFVSELCRQLAETNPRTVFRSGRDRLVFILEHVFVAGMLLALAGVLWMVGGAMRGLVVVKLVLLALFAPVVWKYARVNWPKPFDPRAVPPAMLPK